VTTPPPESTRDAVIAEVDQFQRQADEANETLDELHTSVDQILRALTEEQAGSSGLGFWSMFWPSDGTEFWTLVTAVGTAVLAWFAYWAWKTAQHQLSEMRDQTDRQIEDQEWGRQVEALATYLSALSALQDTPPAQGPGISPEQADARDLRWFTLSSQINIAGNIWRLLHHKNAQEANILEKAEAAIVLSHGQLTSSSQEHGDWITSVHKCIKLFGEWQRADDKAKVSERIAELIRDDFGPLVDEALEQEGGVAALLQSTTGS
jgi:hypothetical protein